jgi:hypothetical protein
MIERERMPKRLQGVLDVHCRVDHDARRIYISRLLKMYAQVFAGADIYRICSPQPRS